MIVCKNENIVFRKIHGSLFLIDISDNYSGDKCALYEINETGLFIWNNIDGKLTIKDLASLLNEEINENINEAEIYDDVYDFIQSLIDRQFLEEKNG